MILPKRVTLEFSVIPPPLNGREGILRLPFVERDSIYSQWAATAELAKIQLEDQPPLTSCAIIYRVRSTQNRRVGSLVETFVVLGAALVTAGIIASDSTEVVRMFLPVLERVDQRGKQGCTVDILPCQPNVDYAMEILKCLEPYVLADTSSTVTD